MLEIQHPLRDQFILIIENDFLLMWLKPQDLWMQFDTTYESIKLQTYSLLKQLVKFGYLKKVYDQNGKQYYSETDKLNEFRIHHCKTKATEVLTEKLRSIQLEQIEKDMEIQITRELSNQLPEINFCLKNHIKNSQDIISELDKKKNIISNIIKNIEFCIY